VEEASVIKGNDVRTAEWPTEEKICCNQDKCFERDGDYIYV
jgi:hypothetical protein